MRQREPVPQGPHPEAGPARTLALSPVGLPPPVQLGVGALRPNLGAAAVHSLSVRSLSTDRSERRALGTEKDPSGVPHKSLIPEPMLPEEALSPPPPSS